MSDSSWPHGLYVAHQALLPRHYPGQNTGVDCCFLLQGIFPTQGLNPGLLHCRQILYHLSHQASLTIHKFFFVFLRSSEVGEIDAVHGSSQRKSLEHGSVWEVFWKVGRLRKEKKRKEKKRTGFQTWFHQERVFDPWESTDCFGNNQDICLAYSTRFC